MMSQLSSTHFSSKQAIVVWLFLVSATLCTGLLADHHGLFGGWTVAVVFLVAILKARSIILYYMEVKHAPLKLRLVFEAWVLITPAMILVLWFIQSNSVV